MVIGMVMNCYGYGLWVICLVMDGYGKLVWYIFSVQGVQGALQLARTQLLGKRTVKNQEHGKLLWFYIEFYVWFQCVTVNITQYTSANVYKIITL